MKFKTIVLFLILVLLGSSMSSCVVHRGKYKKDNGHHYGWYKAKKQPRHKVYVIKTTNQKQPKYKQAPPAKKQSAKKQNKNHWNAKK